MTQDQQIAELKAQVNLMQKDLRNIILEPQESFSDAKSVHHMLKIAKKSLARTPTQCLAEHDKAIRNSAIDECAEIAKLMPLNCSAAHHKYRSEDTAKAMSWDISISINLLKHKALPIEDKE